MTAALENLIAHHERFAEGTVDWWLTPTEAARLTGWPRQRIHAMIQAGRVESRKLELPDYPTIVRLRARDLIHQITHEAVRN